jgi:ABC-type nitrate/sulfonate/bicarbonate transport system permease component
MNLQQRTLILRIALSILAFLVFFALWDWVSINDTRGFLPRPINIFETMISLLVNNEVDPTGHLFWDHVIASLTRVFYGFILAAAVAIPVGLLSGWSVYTDSLSKPLVELFRPIPPFAWIPFAIVFFRDPFDSVFIVYLGAFFPILLATSGAVKTVDPLLADVAKTLGAGKWLVFKKVVVPASLPHIVTGLRIGLGVGWMSIIAAELVGVREGGLGFYVYIMGLDYSRYTEMFAAMFVIGIISFIMITTLVYVERRLSQWAGIH